MYRDVVDRFVLDAADEAERPAVATLGIDVVVAPTLVHLGAPPEPLRDAVLDETRPPAAVTRIRGSGVRPDKND